MALATHRHNETGELLELSEDWLTRFPKDPYTRVSSDDLAKLEAEQRQAAATALGAQPYAAGEETPAAPAAAAAASPASTHSDDEDDDRTSTSRSRF
jgi:hypothetical protein